MDYTEKCDKPIPIGTQRYAYQCENISIEPVRNAVSIEGYIPSNKGKEPYPNIEAELIEKYEIKIERHTGNSISVSFVKRYKDKTQTEYLTTISFSELVNRIFKGFPANVWRREAPFNPFT